MSYISYAKNLPAFWINLDSSTERAARWSENCGPIFANHTRVSAVNALDVSDDELDDFVERWRANVAENVPVFASMNPKWNMYVLRRSAPSPGYRRETRRGELAIVMSHRKALIAGLRAGFKRFVVSEDDALPRRQLINMLTTPAPPNEKDIVIHAGGLGLASHKSDDQAYTRVLMQRNKFAWQPVVQPFNSLCATLYEVTRRGAETLLHVTEKYTASYDQSWSFALASVSSVVARPGLFAQAGASDRNPRIVRDPLL